MFVSYNIPWVGFSVCVNYEHFTWRVTGNSILTVTYYPVIWMNVGFFLNYRANFCRSKNRLVINSTNNINKEDLSSIIIYFVIVAKSRMLSIFREVESSSPISSILSISNIESLFCNSLRRHLSAMPQLQNIVITIVFTRNLLSFLLELHP